MTKFYDLNETAKIIGVDRATIYNWMREGRCPPYGRKDGRYIFEAKSVEKRAKEYNARFKWRKKLNKDL